MDWIGWLLLAFTFYYLLCVCGRPRVFGLQLPFLSSAFFPHPLLPFGLLQTVTAVIKPPTIRHKYKSESAQQLTPRIYLLDVSDENCLMLMVQPHTWTVSLLWIGSRVMIRREMMTTQGP